VKVVGCLLWQSDVVVAGQVHGDLARTKVVVLAQVDDLADDLDLGRPGAVERPARAIPQAFLTQLLESVQPLAEGRPADPVRPARRRNVPGDLLRMT